jgi:hypothetical protein
MQSKVPKYPQLNLYFMIYDSKGKTTDGKFVMVNVGKIAEVDERFSNNKQKTPDFTWITTDVKTYKKFKMLAELVKEHSDENWDAIDYGFKFDQMNNFMSLVKT